MGDVQGRDDLYGFEWDFLVRDRDGLIAVFATAGAGTIPPAVFGELALVEQAVDALDELPSRGESVDLRSQDRLSGNYSECFELSRRGLFTYEWHLHHGPYEQVSAPTVPLVIEDVDRVLAKAAALHRVPVSFAEAAQIDIDEPGRENVRSHAMTAADTAPAR
ncbi:hypothetical protein [Isoptericola sp. NPDC057191]|uniref:hypothetical protein n=1 Tax=Isoptericola sp. NPDC057191 TaxID=3346041 RepID=UPI003638DD91